MGNSSRRRGIVLRTLSHASHVARRALAAAILLGPGALNAATQQGVVLECNEVVSLRATPTFDPPVQGPLTFEWRDATGGVIGTDQFLKTAFPRGARVLAMVVTAPGGRTATNRMAIDVRDTLKPGVSVARPIVDLTRAQAEAGVNIIALAGITAVDQCDPSPRVVASSTGRFPVGDTLASVVAIAILMMLLRQWARSRWQDIGNRKEPS